MYVGDLAKSGSNDSGTVPANFWTISATSDLKQPPLFNPGFHLKVLHNFFFFSRPLKTKQPAFYGIDRMSFRSLPDYGINDNTGTPADSNNGTSTSKPSTSPPTNSEGDSDHPVDIITTLGVYPETKDRVEEHLIKLGKQIEEEEPDCLQWEVFYLNATGELVLIERSVCHLL